jgi:hypothetical protein
LNVRAVGSVVAECVETAPFTYVERAREPDRDSGSAGVAFPPVDAAKTP